MGALDPHIHKLNLAELQGEGKLEAEGVRPQTREQDAINAANLPVGDQGLDLLPSAGLVTSSEDYYPTVAINALMRLLRNPGLSALHGRAVAALFDIIKSMGFNFVLYLPKVVPVLLQLTRGADDLQRRVDMVRALTDLVSIMRQHISRFLKDFLDLVHEFWRGAPVMQPYLLTLLGELSRESALKGGGLRRGVWGRGAWRGRAWPAEARGRVTSRHVGGPAVDVTSSITHHGSKSPCPPPPPTCRADTLQDDFHTYMPDLLPMFVAVFDDAERTGDFAMVGGCLTGWGRSHSAATSVPLARDCKQPLHRASSVQGCKSPAPSFPRRSSYSSEGHAKVVAQAPPSPLIPTTHPLIPDQTGAGGHPLAGHGAGEQPAAAAASAGPPHHARRLGRAPGRAGGDACDHAGGPAQDAACGWVGGCYISWGEVALAGAGSVKRGKRRMASWDMTQASARYLSARAMSMASARLRRPRGHVCPPSEGSPFSRTPALLTSKSQQGTARPFCTR